MSGYEAFVAVINTTITGTPPRTRADTAANQQAPAALDSAAQSTGRDRYKDMVLTAYMGGCLSIEASSLLISGSNISHCSARFVGGGISMLAVTAVLEDTTFTENYGDMVSWGLWGFVKFAQGFAWRPITTVPITIFSC